MKRKINFYQTDFTKFKVANLLPKFSYSKNVQGWSFNRNYTAIWLRFAVTLSITKRSDLNVDRNMAHAMNVEKYMQ